MSKRTYMNGFLYGGIPEKTICPDGRNFSANKLFLLVANHPIGKDECVYFNFKIDSYSNQTLLKYYPLYAGVHKDPVSGTLNNDFALGSLFYSVETGKYSIMEKHLKTASTNVWNPTKTFSRPPSAGEIVTVTIDRPNNAIYYHVEGKFFYGYHPSIIDLSTDPDPVYAALYSNIPSELKGVVNLGDSVWGFRIPNAISIHSAHNKSKLYTELHGIISVDRTPPKEMASITGTTTKIVDIKGDGSLYLNKTSQSISIDNDGLSFKLIDDNGMMTANLPVSSKYKTMVEVYVRDGMLANNELGIPFMVGITNDTADMRNGESIMIPLHHTREHCYEYYECTGKKLTTHVVDNLYTSVPNEEGKYINIGINPIDQCIDIWVDKVLFYSYPITRFKIRNGFYLFLRSDNSFTNYLLGTINFGAAEELSSPPLKMAIPEDYMTLWHYYNRMNIHPVPMIPDIDGKLTVIEKFTLFNKYFNGSLVVEEVPNTDMKKFGHGLNWLMDTYNTISDRADFANNKAKQNSMPTHYDINFPIIPIDDYNKLIASENNGYYPNNPDDPKS